MPPVRARRQPTEQTLQSVSVPAPVGGINSVSPGSQMPPSDCIALFNMVGSEYGLRTRLGSREWCTGLTGAADNTVRTVMGFIGASANGAGNRTFACTSSGIWDVTSSSASPSLVYSFVTTTSDAGWGVAHNVVTSAGHFLVYCDEVNGLILYSEASGTWAAPAMGAGATEISGVDPVNLVFCTMFKGRLLLVERNTSDFYYLGLSAVYGAATKFALGTQFRLGGTLVGLWNWTIDGGAGIDDSLVAISSGGDVAIYQGTDITSATSFGIKGVWGLGGSPPAGRNIATNHGGDVLILSRTGVVPLSKLVTGSTESSIYSTAKIGSYFNRLMLSRSSFRGWALRIHPEDNALVVTIPVNDGAATEQLAMSLATLGWGPYRELPIYSSEVYGGKLYFGTVDGRVCINDGYVDGVTLANPNTYSAITYGGLTAFNNLGNGNQKQVEMIRPTLLSESTNPAFSAAARYNFDFTEVSAVTPSTPGSNAWDAGTWDSATWAGEYTSSHALRGAVGMGTDVAIAFKGAATSRTVLVDFKVMFKVGGML